MNNKYIFGACFLASMAFASCSEDELITNVENQEVQDETGFKELGVFQFGSKLGNVDNGSADSRHPSDIDSNGRPIKKYRLNDIYLLSLTPQHQPTSLDINKVIDYNYEKKINPVIHSVTGDYRVYYKLSNTTENPGASMSGQITLSTSVYGDNPITFDLSVFNLDDLKDERDSHIKLNQFAYDKNVAGNLRGSTLQYTSYNPKTVGKRANDSLEINEYLVGQYAYLPSITDGLNFLKGDPAYPVETNLVTECKDEYFSSSEYLFAAANDKIYVLESVLSDTKAGGYYLKRTYPTAKNVATPKAIEVNRLTSIVNASFMLVDEKNTYFNPKDSLGTLANFKKKYQVDLGDLHCPYATLDGVNTRFFINEYKNADKYTTPGRLVLWAENAMAAKGIEGLPDEKVGFPSMKVNYNNDGDVRRGYGIKGNSYSVIFQGAQEDTQAQQINFWVNVDGANVKITATTNEVTGYAFNRNTAHNVTVFVPARAFADAVKEYRKVATRGADEYVQLNVSSENVVVK